MCRMRQECATEHLSHLAAGMLFEALSCLYAPSRCCSLLPCEAAAQAPGHERAQHATRCRPAGPAVHLRAPMHRRPSRKQEQAPFRLSARFREVIGWAEPQQGSLAASTSTIRVLACYSKGAALDAGQAARDGACAGLRPVHRATGAPHPRPAVAMARRSAPRACKHTCVNCM